MVTEEEAKLLALHSERDIATTDILANSLTETTITDRTTSPLSTEEEEEEVCATTTRRENVHVVLRVVSLTERMMLQEDSVVTTVHLVLVCVTPIRTVTATTVTPASSITLTRKVPVS